MHIDSTRNIISHVVFPSAAACCRKWVHSIVGFTDTLYAYVLLKYNINYITVVT